MKKVILTGKALRERDAEEHQEKKEAEARAGSASSGFLRRFERDALFRKFLRKN